MTRRSRAVRRAPRMRDSPAVNARSVTGSVWVRAMRQLVASGPMNSQCITVEGGCMSGDSICSLVRRAGLLALAGVLWMPTIAFAQSPWERAAGNLATTFTGPLARSLALVAIVIGGPLFMFAEAGAKRQIFGIVVGGGLPLFCAPFLTWLFLRGPQHAFLWQHCGATALPAAL